MYSDTMQATRLASALNDTQMQKYKDDGYLAPLPAIDASSAAEARRRLDAVEQIAGGKLNKDLVFKPHLYLKWASDIVHHPAILDAVESIVGPDILCWSSRLFIKDPHDGGFISWHQDAAFWGLSDSDQIVTAWVALAPTTVENGAMKVVPGTHKRAVEHHKVGAASNMLMRGQEIDVDVDENDAVHLILKSGEMSLHHNRIFHGSDANISETRRIGFAIRYIPAWVTQTTGLNDSATLVRGRADKSNFELETKPQFDLDPDGVALQVKARQAYEKVNARAAEMHAQASG